MKFVFDHTHYVPVLRLKGAEKAPRVRLLNVSLMWLSASCYFNTRIIHVLMGQGLLSFCQP